MAANNTKQKRKSTMCHGDAQKKRVAYVDFTKKGHTCDSRLK